MPRTRLFLLPIALAVVACGGGGGPTSAPATGATQAPGSTTAPGGATMAPGSTTATGGGGGTAATCDAVTLAEVSSTTGVEATSMTVNDDIPGQTSCVYSSAEGMPVVSFVENRPDSPISPQSAFDSVAAGGEAVSGIGDQAIWVALPNTELGSLYVLAGGNLYAISVTSANPDRLDQRKNASMQLGTLIVDRLT